MNYRNVILHSNYFTLVIIFLYIFSFAIYPSLHLYPTCIRLHINWPLANEIFFLFWRSINSNKYEMRWPINNWGKPPSNSIFVFFLDNSLYLISVILNQAWCHSVWSIYKVRIYAFCASLSQSRQLSPVRRDIVRLSLIGWLRYFQVIFT